MCASSVNVAATPERWQVLQKQAALARGFGVDVQLITPKAAGDLYPVMRTDDLHGTLWIPGDGKANPAEHLYIVTDRSKGVHPMLPVMRDPDGFTYYKEEAGGLLMGGFEPVAKPWRMEPISSTFQF